MTRDFALTRDVGLLSEVGVNVSRSREKKKHPPEVHTQERIECPDDLSTVSCGVNCYKNGRLFKIVCSRREAEELYAQTPPPEKPETGPDDYTWAPRPDNARLKILFLI